MNDLDNNGLIVLFIFMFSVLCFQCVDFTANYIERKQQPITYGECIEINDTIFCPTDEGNHDL